MGSSVVVGAGAVGSALAAELAAAGHDVLVLTRSGSGPEGPQITRESVDASDAASLVAACEGATAIYNCANPPYGRWAADWPPIAAALIAAAEASGGVLVTLSNLYGYGPVSGAMTETAPLAARSVKGRVRAQMWLDAKAAHDAGRIRCVELRASDYYGPGLTDQGMLGERCIPRVLVGKPVLALGDVHAPHSFTFVPDVVRALAIAGEQESAWGSAWHVPTAPAGTVAGMVGALARAGGVEPPAVRGMPHLGLVLAGLFSSDLRELKEIAYQFEQPFVVDSTAFTDAFGMAPTPTDQACAQTMAWWRGRLGIS